MTSKCVLENPSDEQVDFPGNTPKAAGPWRRMGPEWGARKQAENTEPEKLQTQYWWVSVPPTP